MLNVGKLNEGVVLDHLHFAAEIGLHNGRVLESARVDIDAALGERNARERRAGECAAADLPHSLAPVHSRKIAAVREYALGNGLQPCGQADLCNAGAAAEYLVLELRIRRICKDYLCEVRAELKCVAADELKILRHRKLLESGALAERILPHLFERRGKNETVKVSVIVEYVRRGGFPCVAVRRSCAYLLECGGHYDRFQVIRFARYVREHLGNAERALPDILDLAEVEVFKVEAAVKGVYADLLDVVGDNELFELTVLADV